MYMGCFLPFLEQAAVFGEIDFTIPAYRPWELRGRTCEYGTTWLDTQLDVHLCPSDQPRNIHTGDARCFAHGNYLANQGWWHWWQRTNQSIYDTRWNLHFNQTGIDKRGPFEKVWGQANKGVRLREITDGLSNTVMLGECRQYEGEDSRGVMYLGSTVYSHEHRPNANSIDQLEWCASQSGADDREGFLNPSAPCTEEFRAGSCHAGRYETSLVLADAPASVNRDRMAALPPRMVDMPAGIAAGRTDFLALGMAEAYCGSPAEATGEEGEATFEILTDMLVELIREVARA
jgi:hypothetical protein